MGEIPLKYLEQLARIETPSLKARGPEVIDDVCWAYCQIRNLVKDIMDGYIALVEGRDRLVELFKLAGLDTAKLE